MMKAHALTKRLQEIEKNNEKGAPRELTSSCTATPIWSKENLQMVRALRAVIKYIEERNNQALEPLLDEILSELGTPEEE